MAFPARQRADRGTMAGLRRWLTASIIQLGGVVRFGRGHPDCFQKDRRKVR